MSTDDKPVAPSSSRREAARRRGEVAFSPTLVGAAALLAGTLALVWLAPGAGGRLVALAGRVWGRAATGSSTAPVTAQLIEAAWAAGRWAAGLALPVLGAALLGALAAGWAQTRGLLSLAALGRRRGARRGMNGMALVATLGVVLVLLREGPVLAGLARTGGMSAVVSSTELLVRLALRVGLVLLAAGLAEHALAWWRRERALRMTRAEAAEEARADGGDPRWRAEVRRRQRRASAPTGRNELN